MTVYKGPLLYTSCERFLVRLNKKIGVAIPPSESDNKILTVASKWPSFQVYKCKLCVEEFLIQDESTKHAYAHVILQTVDMTPLPH